MPGTSEVTTTECLPGRLLSGCPAGYLPSPTAAVLTAKFPSIGTTLIGGHILKLFPQLFPLLRRKRTKPSPGIPHRFALFKGQLAELLIPLTELLSLLRWKGPPFFKPLLGFLTLFGRHRAPLLCPISQALLFSRR